MRNWTHADKRAHQEWEDLCHQIKRSTEDTVSETPSEQKERKEILQNDFVKFCRHYFGNHYMDSDFAWFHKKAAKEITADPKIFGILEWPREHAKSVFVNVMVPMWLYARGEITGMVVVSANQDKAQMLLSDLQAEFVSNQRWIKDYGELAKYGDWSEGKFATTDGYGFWALGRGQSPRGIRKAANRPNYGVIDDIDDKVIVKNEKRVRETIDWILEDLYGALSIKGARLLVAGNRIHKNSILANLVGDIEPEDPKHEGRYHLKVYAIETKWHNKASAENGQPAWKERYTLAELTDKMEKMGYRAARREYFHEHMEEGIVFKIEWIHWVKTLNDKKYDAVEVYCDPSFKHSKDADYKAIVVVGKQKKYLDVLYAWVRKSSVKSMVHVFYDLYDRFENKARYYIEANMLQDLLLDEFDTEADQREYHMPIRGDKRKKPDKFTRIENLTPLFERGLVRFNEKERKNPDMQMLIQQILGFPYTHDDGPDALEGGIYHLQKIRRAGKAFKPRMGKYRRTTKRH